MLVIFTLGSSQSLGIPEIVAASRASSFAQPFFGLIYMLPVDFIFRIFTTGKGRYYQIFINGLSLVVYIIIAILIVNFVWYHNFFEVEQAYYNEAEYLTRI